MVIAEEEEEEEDDDDDDVTKKQKQTKYLEVSLKNVESGAERSKFFSKQTSSQICSFEIKLTGKLKNKVEVDEMLMEEGKQMLIPLFRVSL
jgi:chromatin segregation and condensation protein Rec8/ScpA/Scc1 (kleisin family)